MSDISFSGLGSFVLFLFTFIFLGLVILVLLVRQYVLYAGSQPKSVRMNNLLIKATLCPFIAAIVGMIALQIFNDPSTQVLFDRYLSFLILGTGLITGLIWLIAGFQQLNKQFK